MEIIPLHTFMQVLLNMSCWSVLMMVQFTKITCPENFSAEYWIM